MTIPEVTTELVDEPTAAVNEEPAAPGSNELDNVDPQILEALKSQKDRLYVLKLGETMEALILERSTRSRVEMLPATTYQRLLVHRCAAYYNLSPEHDPQTKTIIVTIAADSRIPARRLAELVPPESSPLPTFKIMRRTIAPRTQSSNSTEDNASDENGSRSEQGSSANGNKARKKRMTIAEREAAYNEARSRIFMDFEEREKIAAMSQTSASSSTLSLASGTTNGGGGSIGAMSDGDNASTAPTESEYSGPAMGSKASKGSSGDRRSLMSEPGPSRNMLRSNAPPFMGPNTGAGNGFSYPSLYEPAPSGYDHAAMASNHGYNPQQPPPPPPPGANGYPMYPVYHQYPPGYMPPYGYYPYPYPQHPPPPPAGPSTTPGENYPHTQPYAPPPHQSYWPSTGPQSPPQPQPRPINSPPPQHAPMHSAPPPQMHMQNYPPPPPQPQAAYGYHPPPPAGYYSNQPPQPQQPLDAQQPHRNTFTNGQAQGHGPKSRPGSRDSVTQNQPQHPFDPAKRNGPGPSRAPWSYGPGVSMGGLPVNGQQQQQSHQQGLEGMGIRVMPPINLPLPQERRRPTSHGSGASHGSGGGARTPADETASTASSSTGSSSSRRTFTSTSSKHPLPPRPDWAVGLKPGQTGLATPPRRPGIMYTPQGTQATLGSQDASSTGSHPQSPTSNHPHSPSHQSSASLESNDFPPLVRQSQDFPPLGQGQKRPPAGAWNNAGGARAILVGTVPLNQTVNGVTISPSATGTQPGTSLGNAPTCAAVNGTIPTPPVNTDSLPTTSQRPEQPSRFDDQDPAFDRPPPRITAELFNPQQTKASKRVSGAAQRVASPASAGSRIASPANGRGNEARIASPPNGRVGGESSMERLVDKVGIMKLGESADAPPSTS